MKLIYEKTGQEVRVGDTVHINNKPFYIDSVQQPHKPGSTGKVYVTAMNESKTTSGYFPGVVGAVWAGRTDQ